MWGGGPATEKAAGETQVYLTELVHLMLPTGSGSSQPRTSADTYRRRAGG